MLVGHIGGGAHDCFDLLQQVMLLQAGLPPARLRQQTGENSLSVTPMNKTPEVLPITAMQPPDPRPQVRLADVAEAAKVSTATVSRVINNSGAVSLKARQRVVAAIDELNWVPNASAIALATNRTRTVGAIMPTLDHQNFARIVERLQSELSAPGTTC